MFFNIPGDGKVTGLPTPYKKLYKSHIKIYREFRFPTLIW